MQTTYWLIQSLWSSKRAQQWLISSILFSSHRTSSSTFGECKLNWYKEEEEEAIEEEGEHNYNWESNDNNNNTYIWTSYILPFVPT